jgi:ADP-ribosylglycohydrolase
MQSTQTIIGAIAGDIIGSPYERYNVKSVKFPLFGEKSRFTDDTVLSVAVADCLLNGKDFAQTLWAYGRQHRGRGYGKRFRDWLDSEHPQPYNSFGNGSAMRVSAVGFACQTLAEVLDVAKQSAVVSHDHPEGIKGAQATAAAIFLARTGKTKQEIKAYISQTFGYDLQFTLDAIRPSYHFNSSCQGSVPQAIVAFLESTDYENAIRLAISIGGDSDTIACITGGIAAAFYKEIPAEIIDAVRSKLPDEFTKILDGFDEKFGYILR